MFLPRTKTSGSSCCWKLSLSIALLFVASIVGAVTLGWDAVPGAKSYALYWGPAPRSYTNAIDVGNSVTGRVTGLKIGSTQYFAVTVTDTNGLQSDFSDEIAFVPVPPIPKTNVAVMVRISSDVAGPWSNIFSLIVTNPQGQLFFSTVISNQ